MQRHFFANKGLSSQGYGFSSSHEWMWELDYKESWTVKNWCFWTVVLEKTLESALDGEESQPVHPKGDQSWIFTGRTDVEAETPILWPSAVKNWLKKTLILGKIEGRRRRGWQGMRWFYGITDSVDMRMIRLWETAKNREAWHAAVHGVTQSQTQLSHWTTIRRDTREQCFSSPLLLLFWGECAVKCRDFSICGTGFRAWGLSSFLGWA